MYACFLVLSIENGINVSQGYVNSLLATLNARHSIRDARDAWMDDDNAHGGIVLHRVGNHSSAGLWGRHKTPMDTKELRFVNFIARSRILSS